MKDRINIEMWMCPRGRLRAERTQQKETSQPSMGGWKMLSVQERRRQLESQYPQWPRRTIASHFFAQAEKFADQPLLITEDRTSTYEQVMEESRRLARALLALGVRRRDKIAVLMANEPEFIFLMIAVSMVGGVVIPINTMLRADELSYVLQQSDTNILVMSERIGRLHHAAAVADLLSAGETKLPQLRQVICIPDRAHSDEHEEVCRDAGFLAWSDFLDGAERVTDDDVYARWKDSEYPDEVAFIIYTSGSTGVPKGVQLTSDMFLRCAYSTCLSRAFELGRRIYCPLPLYHVFAMEEGLLAASFVGGSLVIGREFTPRIALELMSTHEATDMICVPSMLVALVNHPQVTDYSLQSLTALMCAAAPAPVPVWKRAVDLFGLTEICTGYGGTEVTASTMHTEVGDSLEVVVSRVGRIKPGGVSGLAEYGGANVQYKVVDPVSGADLPSGTMGELSVRGNVVTRGYYKKPDETSAVLDGDGWLRTGDLGRMDEFGYFEFLGRSKDLYKVSGENVAPKEVEETISKHPAVSQVYIVGVPDGLTTEAGAAFIELRPGAVCTRSDILAWCHERVARFKIPRHIWFVEASDWPMTGTGKIQKFRLQEMARERIGKQKD